MRFANRQDAGRQLAEALQKYRNSDAVVYALPRGGVVLGYEVARALNIPLDIVVARKIGHPLESEYAICAVNENGDVVCNESEKRAVNKDWLDKAIDSERQEARRRREVYLAGTSHIPAKDRVALVIDDGIATGLTVRVAVIGLKKEEPKKIIVAVPVASSGVKETLSRDTDEVIILEEEDSIGAVGAYYDDFPQVTDEEVVNLLKESRLH